MVVSYYIHIQMAGINPPWFLKQIFRIHVCECYRKMSLYERCIYQLCNVDFVQKTMPRIGAENIYKVKVTAPKSNVKEV